MIDPMHFDRVDHDDVVKKWYVDGLLLHCFIASSLFHSPL
jgi:hypothetical protein